MFPGKKRCTCAPLPEFSVNSTVVSQQEGSGFEPAFVLPLPGGHTVGTDVDGE